MQGQLLQRMLQDIFSHGPSATLSQNVDKALQAITEQLDCDGVFVLGLPDQSGLHRLRPHQLYTKHAAGMQSRDWPLARLEYFRKLIRAGEPVIIDDVNSLPSMARQEKMLLKQWEVQGLMVLAPICFGDTKLALGAVSRQPRNWSESFIQELNHTQTLISSALELTRIANALLESEHKYQSLFNQLPLACAVIDNQNRLSLLNQVARHSLGVFEGQDLTSLLPESEKVVLTDAIKMVRDGVLHQSWCDVAFKINKPNLASTRQSWQRLNFSKMQNAPDSIVLLAEDISEQHRLAAELSFQANYDPLTGLANRWHFEALLAQMISEDNSAPACVAFLDLDQFQVVNNISGHMAGDKLLCQVAMRLKQLVRRGDVVARLGGDEFAILMHQANVESSSLIAGRICQQIANHEFIWQGRQHSVSVSMGLAKIDRSDADIYHVMSHADAACSLAKEMGRNGWHFYDNNDPRMHKLQNEMLASTDILSALNRDDFTLYFQPIVPLQGHESGLHMEILLRLVAPDGKVLSPDTFLPAAERYNLAARVDSRVVNNLLEWAERNAPIWNSLNMVSVNLSATSLGDKTFLQWLELKLQSAPQFASKLCFEITETAALSQLELASDFILMVRQYGCKLALDDFGAGFSSFSYLKLWDLDVVKIDGQFVKNLCHSKDDQAIVRAICQLGQDMHFVTIGEFVEDNDIALLLARLGVDYGQGYHFAKPMALSSLKDSQQAIG
ncbi:EAL domain-containing protein [Shewanella sp. NIFS-20-20]|uniref:sensor domain-containing phosphodiesterase n=1 Tax=Shewanella sp. NIFS-20-20 TaxID=2853806 RepID=UPI001C474106|nr:EAL domain-containing protein [Shewanella sp. NIFS-20-20]MBV7314139.1 EAL domain-containing protein [Shewanella sp. NIFS-20-20]